MADTKKRIKDYTETTVPSNDDYLLIDGDTDGTRKIKASLIGGGSANYIGTTEPSSDLGSDGEGYIKTVSSMGFKYLRLKTTKVNSVESFEFGEIKLRDNNGAYYSFNGAKATCDHHQTTDGPVQNLIDGNSETFFRSAVPSTSDPVNIYLRLGTPINTNVYNTLELYYGRYPEMMPSSFVLYGSVDGQTWVELLSVSNSSGQYSGSLATQTFKTIIDKTYYKIDGKWINNAPSLKEIIRDNSLVINGLDTITLKLTKTYSQPLVTCMEAQLIGYTDTNYVDVRVLINSMNYNSQDNTITFKINTDNNDTWVNIAWAVYDLD